MSVIQNIGMEQAPPIASRVGIIPEQSSQQAKSVKSGSGSNGQEYFVKLSNEAFDVANLQEAKNSFNEMAKEIRTADISMQTANEYIEQMKANLNRIIKNYPPFPPGSEERVAMLRSYSVFRKQIDQLSFIPEDRPNAVASAVQESET